MVSASWRFTTSASALASMQSRSRTTFEERAPGRPPHISREDRVISAGVAQRRHELRADLPGRTGDQYSFHFGSTVVRRRAPDPPQHA
jgi:hypothetical protein